MLPIPLLLSILSPLVALLIGLKKRLTLLWMYPLTGLVFDLLITILKRGFHIRSMWLGNLFFLAEFIIVSRLYQQRVFPRNALFVVFVGILSASFMIHTYEHHLLQGINKVGASIFSFSYILYALYGFHDILKKPEVVYLEKSWFFWLNVALIIYGSGSFFIFLLRELMVQTEKDAYKKIWDNIFLVLNIVRYLLIGIALYHYDEPAKGRPGIISGRKRKGRR